MNQLSSQTALRWSLRTGPPGFTLVELMIVVALIAALAALSAPSISSSMERNRLTQLNRDVANGFLEARSHAMRHGQAVFVEIDPNDGDQGRISFYEPRDATGTWSAGSCVRAADNGPDAVDDEDSNVLIDIRPEERGLGVIFETPDPDVNRVCISPTGRVMTTSGTPLAAAHQACEDNMNLLIPIISPDSTGDLGDLRDCVDDNSVERELAKFSMIHVAYGGQVRVIR